MISFGKTVVFAAVDYSLATSDDAYIFVGAGNGSADVGVAVLAILNSMRTLRSK